MDFRLFLAAGALAPVVALAGCTKATPELVLRAETETPPYGTLCERMAEDFDMVLAGGSELRGRLFRVSHATRMISARGEAWGFTLIDENPEETCIETDDDVICAVRGPAEFRVQSSAGRATYRVKAGERAQVASEGAVMTCQEQP